MKNYKLKSEIKDFILQKAREHPELGCRKLSRLIQEAFKVDISKSTVGTVLKSEGLNKPAGRRSAKEKVTKSQSHKVTNRETLLLSTDKQPELLIPAPESVQEPALTRESAQNILPSVTAEQKEAEPKTAVPNMGCWFLKAAELSLGGIQAISGILSSIKSDKSPSDLVAVLETLLYLALFGAQEYNDLSPVSRDALSVLTGKKYSPEDVQRRLDYLEPAQRASLEIFNRLVALRTGVLAIKFILEDNSFFFLDAGCHSIWSTDHIPAYFSSGLHKTRECLNECILENTHPLILQAPPGFDAPTSAFLNFIASFQSEKPDKAIKRIELYSEDNLLIDIIQPQPQKKRYFILGLWPWQYKNRDFARGFGLPLRSLAMTNNDDRKVLDIITNLEKEKHNDNEVIGDYLEHWPNLEIGYQDFLDKIGHFHQRPQTEWKQKNNVQFPEGRDLTLSVLLDYWRQELNLYCQKYFFPLSCREWDFLLLKERFYNLRAKVDFETAMLKVIFELPEGFAHLKDLRYGCQRVNEADIFDTSGRRLFFLT